MICNPGTHLVLFRKLFEIPFSNLTKEGAVQE